MWNYKTIKSAFANNVFEVLNKPKDINFQHACKEKRKILLKNFELN